jgi:GNAT superfamily N-acetyltransferase
MKHLKLFEEFVNEKSIQYPGYDGVKITGYVDGDKAKLDHIEVKAAQRGSGIGTSAVEDFEQWAKEQGAKYVEIDAYKKSVKFWDNMGYELEAEFPVIGGYKQDYKTGIKQL